MSLVSLKWTRVDSNKAYLEVLDQLLLPFSSKYITVKDTTEGWTVINTMQVRGAPLIAICGCLSLAAELVHLEFEENDAVHTRVVKKMNYLVTARPTAVNIKIAKDKLILFSESLRSRSDITPSAYKERIIDWCIQMLEDDVLANKQIGKFGSDHILSKSNKTKLTILTHCNTGSLATAGYGTALGVIRSLHERNCIKHVYYGETRPYLQGARLTRYELDYEKIPSSLIVEGAVGSMMEHHGCDAVIVGADRIARNGDTANKIGTFTIAMAAKYLKVPFYVCATISTIDFSIASGREIVIEERDPMEVTSISGIPIAEPGKNCWNPAFDVTPADLITGIITEEGVVSPGDLYKKYNC